MGILIGILVFAIVVGAVAGIAFLVIVTNSYLRYGILPKYISVETCEKWPVGKATYTLIKMDFKRWRQLFELHPKTFVFIYSYGVATNPTRSSEHNYRITHPCYVDEKNNSFSMIKFGFLDYIRYYFYKNTIIRVLCSLDEQEISMAIVGDIREKIDRIAAEANRDIQKTLDLQKEIMLRLSDEESERRSEEL